MLSFPKPIKLSSNCSRWPLSRLEQYEAERVGHEYKQRLPADEVYLSDYQVAARYNVHKNSVWRWARVGGGA
jgi:hypothetical protein